MSWGCSATTVKPRHSRPSETCPPLKKIPDEGARRRRNFFFSNPNNRFYFFMITLYSFPTVTHIPPPLFSQKVHVHHFGGPCTPFLVYLYIILYIWHVGTHVCSPHESTCGFRMWSHANFTCDYRIWCSTCGLSVHMWSPHMISACEVHMWTPLNSTCGFPLWCTTTCSVINT